MEQNEEQQMQAMFKSRRTDPVSGNEIPPGSLPKEVRDDVPAMLSEGEYVVPADVLRFFGVKFFEDLRKEAKMGLHQMDRDGRIGGEPLEAEDELPFSDEELMVEEGPMEAAKGALVGYQEGGAQLPFDVPTYLDVPSIPGLTGPTTGAVGIEYRTFENDAGMKVVIPFFNGEPMGAVPAGYYPEGTAPKKKEEQTTEDRGEGRDGNGMQGQTGTTTEAKAVTDMSDEEISKGLTTGKNINTAVSTVAGLVSPALGAALSVGAKARYNDLLEEAKNRGLAAAEGKERQGSIFGGEASLMEGLNDVNNDGKVDFGDTWMGDLLGFDGKMGVQGPGLSGSRTGDRRAGWNEADTAGYEAAAVPGSGGRGAAGYGLSPAEQAAATTSKADSSEDFAGYVDPYAENEKYMAKGGLIKRRSPKKKK